MPILFQSRNIRRLLGMYVRKQAEQEVYLIAQHPVNTSRVASLCRDARRHFRAHRLI